MISQGAGKDREDRGGRHDGRTRRAEGLSPGSSASTGERGERAEAKSKTPPLRGAGLFAIYGSRVRFLKIMKE